MKKAGDLTIIPDLYRQDLTAAVIARRVGIDREIDVNASREA